VRKIFRFEPSRLLLGAGALAGVGVAEVAAREVGVGEGLAGAQARAAAVPVVKVQAPDEHAGQVAARRPVQLARPARQAVQPHLHLAAREHRAHRQPVVRLQFPTRYRPAVLLFSDFNGMATTLTSKMMLIKSDYRSPFYKFHLQKQMLGNIKVNIL